MKGMKVKYFGVGFFIKKTKKVKVTNFGEAKLSLHSKLLKNPSGFLPYSPSRIYPTRERGDNFLIVFPDTF